jgi:hypothetical protein
MRSKALLAPALLAALAGCSSAQRAYFAPARTRAELVSPHAEVPVATHQFVPEEFCSDQLRIACEARMFEDEVVGGVTIPTLRVRVWLYNYSRRRIELRPEEFVAEDDLGRCFKPSEVWHDERKAHIVIAKPPGRSTVDVFFHLPEGYDLSPVRAIRLKWGFRIDSREFRHETLFDRGRDHGFRDPFYALGGRSS